MERLGAPKCPTTEEDVLLVDAEETTGRRLRTMGLDVI
jgi:hypothetical protein